MAETKLVGQNYETPDIRAKVTGRARYSEDFRAPGMLFARLLLSPYAHAKVRSIDTSAAAALPGVKAILVPEDVPGPKDQVNDMGQVIRANPYSERALTAEPLYQGSRSSRCRDRRSHRGSDQEIRSAGTCCRSARPLETLRPGGRRARATSGSSTPTPAAALPQIRDLK
jgi:hypothetical protein